MPFEETVQSVRSPLKNLESLPPTTDPSSGILPLPTPRPCSRVMYRCFQVRKTPPASAVLTSSTPSKTTSSGATVQNNIEAVAIGKDGSSEILDNNPSVKSDPQCLRYGRAVTQARSIAAFWVSISCQGSWNSVDSSEFAKAVRARIQR